MLLKFIQQRKLRNQGTPRRKTGKKWSIGLFTGNPLESLKPYSGNPIITSADISDCRASFVADPFLLQQKENYYLFFEILNKNSGRGEIGLAISPEGRDWQYEGLILRGDVHLSYPLVFQHQGENFMLPEMSRARKATLYRAVDFPGDWEICRELPLPPRPYRDSTLMQYQGRWWLFTTWDDTRLHLYSSRDLLADSWEAHPANPVARGRYARPAGRILQLNNRLYRLAQDPLPGYGSRVMLHEIQKLNREEYQEILLGPYLTPGGRSWNSHRMHHADFHYPAPEALRSGEGDWLVIADGYQEVFNLDSLEVRYRQLRNFSRKQLALRRKKHPPKRRPV